MNHIIFEITDLVGYFLHSTQVTGIQRYQVSMIRACAAQAPDRVQVTFLTPEFIDPENAGRRWLCRAVDIFYQDDLPPPVLLARLGMVERGFPSRATVKRLLSGFGRRKVARVVRKVDIYLSAALFRERYMKMLHLPDDLPEVAGRLPYSRPDRDDVLIITGVTIGLASQHAFAAAHKAASGVVIQGVCDVISILRPEYFSAGHGDTFAEWMKEAHRYATHFACISESTAHDLMQVLDLAPQQVQVVPLQHNFPGRERVRTAGAGNGEALPYVLCVGTLEFRKNGSSLLRAWRKLMDRHGAALPRLVFAGKRGWRLEEFEQQLRQDAALADAITLTGAVTDVQLADLYRGCLLSVYPSRYEGWGLPVGESLWFGKFCITSRASSMPEVGGELCDYINPDDVDELAAVLERAIFDADYRRSREQQIFRAPLRTWHEVGADLLTMVDAVQAKQPVSCAA